jgi:hypothetical protein
MGGKESAQRLFLRINEPKNTGARSAVKNPLVNYFQLLTKK